MTEIPRLKTLDSSIGLMIDPYRFISEKRDEIDSDVFETRVLLAKTICLSGAEGAELFYDQDYFTRVDTVPGPMRKTLAGKHSVLEMDGAAHKHRKTMLMSLMSDARREKLTQIFLKNLKEAALDWEGRDEIVFYKALHPVLTRSSFEWNGIPLSEEKLEAMTEEMVALFDKAGRLGLPHIESRMARKHLDEWAAEIIAEVRSGTFNPPEDTAAYVIAHHRDLEGNLLDKEAATAELLNLLRPVTAISIFLTLAATALHLNPVDPKKFEDKEFLESFIYEVRRFFPVFPQAIAKVKKNFSALGYDFHEGEHALLDVYGTNHDPKVWEDPMTFKAGRFVEKKPTPFNLIPQGGGDHFNAHRCLGEWITIDLMKVIIPFLTRDIAFDVPKQDLEIDFHRLSAMPKSFFVMRNVRSNIH
ncbi:MAG: cytochrome P450 [Proteobacteria bacterium]|nr:MAG: cytochrome P450 [Pseudomonadota bacterium]